MYACIDVASNTVVVASCVTLYQSMQCLTRQILTQFQVFLAVKLLNLWASVVISLSYWSGVCGHIRYGGAEEPRFDEVRSYSAMVHL
jgi:hypothetical protein